VSLLSRLGLILLLLLPAGLPAQDEIKRRQNELNTLRDQIREFETRIKDQQRDESATLDMLDNYDQQGTLLRKLISRMKRQAEDLQKRIEATRGELKVLGDELGFLKQHYAAYVRAVYKAGRTHDAELLLSSASLNQFTVRNEYLQRFASQRKHDTRKIAGKKLEIERVQSRAQAELTEQRRTIAEKAAEEDRLGVLAEERRSVLQKIRKDKTILQRELTRKTRAAKDMEQLISRLIEADRIKREKEEAEARKREAAPPPEPVSEFGQRKGRLPWPVSEGTVVAHFGNQRHPTLKTITQNIGIDIAVKPGSDVRSVAAGEVATIWWLPSFGNLIIIHHYSGYRTIYSHLAEILVAEGQKVTEGETLGVSGESIDGPRLHFEIWKDREKLNPELWLGRR
jgi:septal ring factor EnvC (AmiA/AmiB activator)